MTTNLPEQAVEAAAWALAQRDNRSWPVMAETDREQYRAFGRAALTAALPHLIPAALTLDELDTLVDHLMADGTRGGLMLADAVNKKFGRSARKRAARETGVRP